MGMLAAVNAPSRGGDIDDLIHVPSEDEDADDEDSMLSAVGKAATRKRGAGQPAKENSRVKQKIGLAA